MFIASTSHFCTVKSPVVCCFVFPKNRQHLVPEMVPRKCFLRWFLDDVVGRWVVARDIGPGYLKLSQILWRFTMFYQNNMG